MQLSNKNISILQQDNVITFDTLLSISQFNTISYNLCMLFQGFCEKGFNSCCEWGWKNIMLYNCTINIKENRNCK